MYVRSHANLSYERSDFFVSAYCHMVACFARSYDCRRSIHIAVSVHVYVSPADGNPFWLSMFLRTQSIAPVSVAVRSPWWGKPVGLTRTVCVLYSQFVII